MLRVLVIALLLLVASLPSQRTWAGDDLERYQVQLQQLFRRLDRDGDGRLVLEEAMVNAYLRRHFERLDRGGKGYLVPDDLR